MPSLHIEPFRDDLLNEAATLLAARHREQRAHDPLLPARFAETEGALAAVTTAWREADMRGVAARRDGQLIGFLLMAPRIETIWGRSVWARLGGHAVHHDAGADLYRDLYAALATQWVQRGCLNHYAMIPASDRAALDAWFALSFGQQQAYALLALPVANLPNPFLDPAVTIRRANPDDLERLLDVANLVGEHQAATPVFGAFLPEARDDRRSDYTELLADPQATLWIATEGDQVLGFALFMPEEPSNATLYIPDHCIELSLAATRPEQRGRGIGQALAAHGLTVAAEAGFTSCLTDWRTTNLLSSRFWPHLGFRPIAYRLERRIDERALWAK